MENFKRIKDLVEYLDLKYHKDWLKENTGEIVYLNRIKVYVDCGLRFDTNGPYQFDVFKIYEANEAYKEYNIRLS